MGARPSGRSMDYIFENNRRWVEASLDKDPETFSRHAKSQHPKYLYIGCSDSRVPAQNMMVRATVPQARAVVIADSGWSVAANNHHARTHGEGRHPRA